MDFRHWNVVERKAIQDRVARPGLMITVKAAEDRVVGREGSTWLKGPMKMGCKGRIPNILHVRMEAPRGTRANGQTSGPRSGLWFRQED
jgi:hypothetical protein